MSVPPGRSREELAHTFQAFASAEAQHGSPLYALLAPRIAQDDALLDLAAQTRSGQPAPIMLFGAVHDLLLHGLLHPLAKYYPTLGGNQAADEHAFAAFRDLCFAQREAIVERLTTRLTQTNETRRCTYLLPAFATVAALANNQALALVEIGPSAGLNLLWDRYGYDYGDGQLIGDPAAPLQLSTELRGTLKPPIPATLPVVVWRVGVEVNPLNLSDEVAMGWLEALIWPEHVARIARLRTAIEGARSDPPPIMAGNALELLPALLAQAPADAALCVYHTHVTYQFSSEMRAQLRELLAAAALTHPLYHLSCEGFGDGWPRLTLSTYHGASVEEQLLAITSGHGNWLEWRAEHMSAS